MAPHREEDSIGAMLTTMERFAKFVGGHGTDEERRATHNIVEKFLDEERQMPLTWGFDGITGSKGCGGRNRGSSDACRYRFNQRLQRPERGGRVLWPTVAVRSQGAIIRP